MTRKTRARWSQPAVLAVRRPRGVRGRRRETRERTGGARAEVRDAPRGAQVTNQGATRGHARAARVGASRFGDSAQRASGKNVFADGTSWSAGGAIITDVLDSVTFEAF